jgi:hypothetical protein
MPPCTGDFLKRLAEIATERAIPIRKTSLSGHNLVTESKYRVGDGAAFQIVIAGSDHAF